MTSEAAPARRTLIVLVAVIAVLVIVALVSVFTRGERPLLDESTPEGVVQRYSAAVLDGDEDAAMEYLTNDVQETCGTVQHPLPGDIRVTLSSSTINEDSADVSVLINRHDGGPFGSEYSYEETFQLEKEGDGWRVEMAPWELTICSVDGVVR